jgi:hypothetical protein
MFSTTSDIENTLNSTKVDTCREREGEGGETYEQLG